MKDYVLMSFMTSNELLSSKKSISQTSNNVNNKYHELSCGPSGYAGDYRSAGRYHISETDNSRSKGKVFIPDEN